MTNGIDSLIQVESKSRLGRLRQRLAEKRTDIAMRASTKRARRRQAKQAIENIRAQERKSLQRRFIRQQEKQRLAKQFKVKSLKTRKVIGKKNGKSVLVETIETFGRPQSPRKEIDFASAFIGTQGLKRDPKKKNQGITLF